MRAAEYRYSLNGEIHRVIVAGDVVALPDDRWSLGNFAGGITIEWMLHSGRLPGTRARRQLLARLVVQALQDHRIAGLEDVRAALAGESE